MIATGSHHQPSTGHVTTFINTQLMYKCFPYTEKSEVLFAFLPSSSSFLPSSSACHSLYLIWLYYVMEVALLIYNSYILSNLFQSKIYDTLFSADQAITPNFYGNLIRLASLGKPSSRLAYYSKVKGHAFAPGSKHLDPNNISVIN